LQELASRAESLAARGEVTASLAAWREALDLLPPGSTQRLQVESRIGEVSRRAGSTPPAAAGSSWRSWRGGGVLGALAFGAWKLKAVLVLLLTKGKLLLLGLTNAGTLLSLSLSMGLYWNVFGWRLAALFLVSLYIHEMGHVGALRKLGIKAGAPMFIPGLGAFVLLKQHPANPREDARIGLAGPIWGAGAALAAFLASLVLGSPLLAATALWGAWINLFNLLPIWQLDGGRAFRALSRWQRAAATAALFGAWAATRDPLAFLLGLVAAFRTLQGDGSREGDRTAMLQYIALVAILAVLWKAAQPLTKVAGLALP
jgi:Zn-dependent protease